mmetsp:Transcript_23496/g.72276  ORF Transcript_23496/g.72276 Transcript_23496/m.72276 type:complete len:236 (+) Transcript_23496:28-735(+)
MPRPEEGVERPKELASGKTKAAVREALAPQEQKKTKARVTLRIWSCPIPPHVAHSYLAGWAEFGGLGERLETMLPFDPAETTLRQLRHPIQEFRDDGTMRRSPMYQAFLATMNDLYECNNPHNWPRHVAMTYRFGLLQEDGVPTVIPTKCEDDLVSKWLPKPLEVDLILVPQSQVGPDDLCLRPPPPPTRRRSTNQEEDVQAPVCCGAPPHEEEQPPASSAAAEDSSLGGGHVDE